MGCDIHSRVEVKKNGRWTLVCERLFPMDLVWQGETHTMGPFDWRSYGMFSFLAGVRNYSFVPVLSEPRGLPEDRDCQETEDDAWRYGDHSHSWLLLSELLGFDYDQTFEDRRCMKDGNGAADSGPGNGRIVTFREFLGTDYFRDLEIMKGLASDPSNIRIVFGFDN